MPRLRPQGRGVQPSVGSWTRCAVSPPWSTGRAKSRAGFPHQQKQREESFKEKQKREGAGGEGNSICPSISPPSLEGSQASGACNPLSACQLGPGPCLQAYRLPMCPCFLTRATLGHVPGLSLQGPMGDGQIGGGFFKDSHRLDGGGVEGSGLWQGHGLFGEPGVKLTSSEEDS